MSPPMSVSPEPAFIAASAASQIVTNDHDSHAETWYDQHGFEISSETALVSPAALTLVNNFLDNLLFNFLALSGSTSLSTLRPAVIEVLKPKLAKDAINNADEELREYLGGGDDEELLQSTTSPSPADWDLELVWKRTRLRCMVYSSLGDMEEEDEDHHMEEGCLEEDDDSLGGTVSPAVAIFLTSILEYLGEQALIVAGQAAWHRMRVKYEKEIKDGSRTHADLASRIVIEEVDMERTALDRTLGRLWRAWKKRIRTPGLGHFDPSSRSFSRDLKAYITRRSSSATEGGVPPPVQEDADDLEITSPMDEGTPRKEAEALDLDDVGLAAAVPLPIGGRDIDEIEVPGLVHYSDEEDDSDGQEEDKCVKRPKSLMLLPLTTKAALPTPTGSEPHTPTRTRHRSNSLPTPAASPYTSPQKRAQIDEVVAAVTAETIQSSDESMPREISTEPVESVVEPLQAMDSVDGSEAEPDQPPPKSAKRQSMGNIPTIIGGAVAAVAAATMSGVSAATQRTAETGKTDVDDSDYEEIAEARVMTSSRISIGGRSLSARSNSPANSDLGTKAPLTISTSSLLVRSGSLRLVDVNSPRTPSTRSRGSSKPDTDSSAHPRSGEVSRSSSVHTQPLMEEQHPVEDNRALRASGAGSVARSRASVLSISEAEENAEPSAGKVFEPARGQVRGAPISETKSSGNKTHLEEERKSQLQESQPMSGSLNRQSPPTTYSPQRSPTMQQVQSQSKVSPPHSGTFFHDGEVERLPRSSKSSPQQSSPKEKGLPKIPDRHANRQRHGHTESLTSQAQPATIGIVSVNRHAGSESPEAGRPSQDQSTIRQLHNSGSSTTSSSYRTRPTRGSQDSTSTRPEDMARNFEELIQSNETIQYTLTPDTMREIEVSECTLGILEWHANNCQGSPRTVQNGSPLVPIQSRKSEDAARALRERAGSSATNKTVEVKRSASVTRPAALRPQQPNPLASHPVSPLASNPVQPVADRAPPVSMQNRPRGAAPQARDARVPRESLVEFAEFIRATGPSDADAGPNPVRRSPSLALRKGSGKGSTSSSKASLSMDQGRPSTLSNTSRPRLQAREASLSNGDDNSDLIDFIRRGPPNAGGTPRIPRTVAPFRTTMDSDQLTSAIGGRAVDATIPDGLHDTRHSQGSTVSPSIQSSVNSQSALLGRNKPLPAAQSSNQFDEPDMMPVRKTRRVKDPYAIDFSDEEDDVFDEQLPARRKPAPKEESLIDFLNSQAPPANDSAPVPFSFNRTQSMPQEPMQAPRKKASATSLMSRFRTNSSANINSSKQGSKRPTSAAKSIWDSRSLSSRAGGASTHTTSASRGHIPIQVNIPSGGDLFGTDTPPVPSIPAKMNSSRPKVPMKKFEPRDAVSVPSRGTSDLADFLRSSEPPAPSAPAPFTAQPESNGGGSRFFSRRKKSTYA